MPSKKKKFNARFPPARIKKIMQLDEDVGKVASAVPVMISRALEIFMENLLVQSSQLAGSKGARTLTSSHLKQVGWTVSLICVFVWGWRLNYKNNNNNVFVAAK